MLAGIKNEGDVSYQHFTGAAELRRLVETDLAVLLSERFTVTLPQHGAAAGDEAPLAGALPVPATPLVGREQEVAAVEALVLSEGVRLVTLTGPGGSESRLAVEAAGGSAGPRPRGTVHRGSPGAVPRPGTRRRSPPGSG